MNLPQGDIEDLNSDLLVDSSESQALVGIITAGATALTVAIATATLGFF